MTDIHEDHDKTSTRLSRQWLRQQRRLRQQWQQQWQDDDDDDDDAPVPENDDILLGARRIAEHLTKLLGVPIDANGVYYASRMQKLPLGKFGMMLIASKRRLARYAHHLARGSAVE
jgi:hypothetical protein